MGRSPESWFQGLHHRAWGLGVIPVLFVGRWAPPRGFVDPDRIARGGDLRAVGLGHDSSSIWATPWVERQREND